MGRKKSTSTRRKPKVQLEDNKKPDSSRAASNFDYAQISSAKTGVNRIESQHASEDGVKASDSDQPQEGGAMESRLAGFLKEIYELGSSEQGEVHVDNEQGPTPGQSVTESNGEANDVYNKVSSEAVDKEAGYLPSQQEEADSSQSLSSDPSQPEVTFWQEVTDANTNHVYYWNQETNQVSWTLPANGVIANDVGSGTGTGQDGMGTDNSMSIDGTNSVATSDVTQKAPTGSGVKSSSKKATKKVVEVDMFESPVDQSQTEPVVGPVMNPSAERPPDAVAKTTVAMDDDSGVGEKVSSKKRKASPPPVEADNNGRHEDVAVEKMDAESYQQNVKKQRLSAPVGGEGVGGESSDTTTPPVSKHAEQMLRFQVSNVADELSRKLQYLHVSSEGLSDLQVLQIQLQTRLTDWKEGGLSSKYMLSKLKQFNVDLEGYERSSAPEGWKFVWDSSTCRYKFYNLSTGESSWSYPMLSESTSSGVAGPQAKATTKREAKEEEFKGQDDSMETDKQAGTVQQPQQPVGPVGPVYPVSDKPKMPEVTMEQPRPQPAPVSQEKPKPVQPVSAASKIPPSSQSSVGVGKSKGQKLASSYQVPTAEYLKAPEGTVLPVSRFQKRMEEKQAELENPVEGWNLSVKEVRNILSGKNRPSRRSALNDDVIREGDYPMDDDEEEEEERTVGGVIDMVGEGHTTGSDQQFIAEFPPPGVPSPPHVSTRQTRSSTAKKQEQPVSQVSDVATSIANAKMSTIVSDPRKKSKKKQSPPSLQQVPMSQPTALPPPHLKPPISMVISRDPRVAKRQQQQLLQNSSSSPQSTPPPQQQGGEGNGTAMDVVQSPKDNTENSSQKTSEVNEARIRERLLLRQKYRIRKVSDRRDSREESSEERQTSPSATHPPPPPLSASPAKSCLVKSPTAVGPTQSEAKPPTPHQQITADTSTSTLPERAAEYLQPPRQPAHGGGSAATSAAEESVEQSTGELELSPHKKAVFVLSGTAAPIDVTSLPTAQPPEGRGLTGIGPTHEVLPDSRVEPETGEVESAVISEQCAVGTGSSLFEATPTTEAAKEERGESEREEGERVTQSSESSDNEGESDKGRQEEGVSIGKCYMDREEEDKEREVASDKEAKEDESDQSDQDRQSRSSRRKKRRHSSRSKSRSRSRSRDSRRKSSRKSSRRRKHDDDYSDYSDEQSRSRRYDDDRSDYSDDTSGHRSSHRSSRKYRSSKYESSSKSRRSSRRHRRSRSRSRDSRERDERRRSRDGDRDRPPFSGSGKHKKRDKKDKKKRRHRSSRSRSHDEKSKPLPTNVLVGKVGKVGSVRTLGQDKKPSESEDTGDAQNAAAAADNGTTNQISSAQNSSQQSQQQQQYQQMGYYQHPSTGQVPYYGTTAGSYQGTPTGTYQDYMYGYSQDPYQQQAAWQAWQQQQQTGGGAGSDAGQQTWSSSAATGHAQNQQQYVAYPIAGGMGVAPPPPPSTSSSAAEAPLTRSTPSVSDNTTSQETTSKEQPVVEQPTPGESDQPQTSSIPPPMTDDPLPTETPTTNTTTTFAAGFDLSSVATPLDNEAPEPPAIEEGAETPLASPKEPMEEDKGEEGGAEAELEEAAEEEIMECDMEIEDESPVASGDEATPLDEGAKSILLATQIPVPPSVTSSNVIGGGQKVEQVLPPPISQESAMTKSLDEEDEPLPPGVEVEEKDQAEPLPPGIENGDNTPGPPISSTGSDTVETQSHGGGEAMGGGENGDVASKDSGEVATSTAVAVTTTTNTGSVADSQTATPPTQGAVSAAYSAYSSAVAASQAPPTSYTTASAAGYYQQPGAAQYSYAYGQQQGYGDYAAYSAYMQQAAYAGYTPQYYQAAYGAYGTSYPGYYATTPYQQPQTSQPTSTTPTSTANKDKPPPKIMMEQWNAFKEAATKK